MALLLRQALDTIRDEKAPHGLRAVGASTLLTAFEREVETPSEAPLAVWNWLVATGNDWVRLARWNGIPGAEVVRLAVAVLKDPVAGEDIQDLARTVLERSKHLSVITEADMLALTDGEPKPEQARRLVWVVEAVHEQIGVSNDLLRATRDRWSRSSQAHVRESSVDIARLLPGVDDAFVTRMLDDSAPGVRSEVVNLLEQAEGGDRARALGLLQKQLTVEEHVRVRSDLHSAIGTLLPSKAR